MQKISRYMCLKTISLLVFSFGLVACGNSLDETPPPATAEMLSVSDLMDEDADGAGIEGTPFNFEDAEFVLNALPEISSEEILAAWEIGTSLASTHDFSTSCGQCHDLPGEMPSDARCHGCHLDNAEGVLQIEVIEDELCLNCHGPTHSDLTTLTANYQPGNPHDYHYTKDVACVICHSMHQPTESPCGLCHESIELTKPKE